MLTELKLSNFRIFDDEVKVRFRPITVLIGRNSSGKSSIVKLLLMLQQSSGPGKSQFLTAEGDRVQLGNFSRLKNSKTSKRTLQFELAARSNVGQFGYALSRSLGSSEEIENSRLLFKAGAEFSYGRRARMGTATLSVVDVESGANYLKVDTRILEDSTFLVTPASFGVRPQLNQALTELESLLKPEVPTTQHAEQFGHTIALLARATAEAQLSDLLRYQINSIRHLSPTREESQRVILTSYPPADDVGQRGQFALPHLQQIVTEREEGYEFLRTHMERVAGIEEVRFKTSSGYISQVFARSKATGAEVLIADYGFGVSQCLPIFVQGTIMAPFTYLMVEQPEAQLHPTAQLELGSFFADLWNRRRVGSIIETHSDNILLRLRRLIASKELSHQDVSVAFFTLDESNLNMPVIRNLDIYEDGSMEAGLPMEFFGADVLEGLKLGARV